MFTGIFSNMCVSEMQDIGDAVRSVLKTLECAICLDLLKSPVSVGCGHFFCKYCISNVLDSNYRAPCPLCKRSFTRRGIQDATQRNSMISAANKLAESCRKLTGFVFYSKGNSQDTSKCESKCTDELPVPDPAEKVKISFLKTDVNEKKRKSSEKDSETEIVSNECEEDVVLNSADDEIFPVAKKLHFQTDDHEENELPSLECLLDTSVKPAKVVLEKLLCSSNEKEKEHVPLATLPKRKNEIQRKYSRIKYHSKVSENLFDELKSSKGFEKTNDLENIKCKENVVSNVTELQTHSCSIKPSKNIVIKRKVKSKQRNIKLKDRTNIKDAINTLRSKTDQTDLQTKDSDIIKVNDSNDLKMVNEPIVTENENSLLPQTMSNISTSVKALTSKKRGRPKKIRNDYLTDEETSSPLSRERKVSTRNKINTETSDANSSEKECYNLKEISLCNSSALDHDQIKDNVNVEGLLQDVCLPDTAVSVHSITSPPANKSISFRKSPGWTRVKQDGKDFRVKTFSTLSVEKNSPICISKDVSECAENELKKQTKGKFVQISMSEVSPKEVDKRFNYSTRLEGDKSNCEGLAKDQIKSTLTFGQIHSENEKNSKNDSNAPEHCDTSQPKKSVLDCPTIEDDEQNVDFSKSILTNMQCSVKLVKLNLGSQVMSGQTCSENSDQDLKCRNIITETPFVLPCSEDDKSAPEIDAPFSNGISDGPNVQQVDNVGLNLIENQTLREDFVTDLNNDCLPKTLFLQQSSEKHNQSALMPILEQNKESTIVTNKFMHLDDVNDNERFVESINSIIGKKSLKQLANTIEKQNKPTLITNYQSFDTKNEISNAASSSLLRQCNIGKVATCEITMSQSIAGKHENDVIFMEHSQQTSQSLFNCNIAEESDVCNVIKQKPVVKYTTKNFHNTAFKYPPLPNKNPWICTIANPPNLELVPKTQKTKVLKKTCLTLEEIQDFFLKSSQSGQTESICSIPFLAGEFKLNISVAEETLNVSVVKVIDEVNADKLLSNENLFEKGIQTSALNSPTHSPTSIIPSSNTESETSLLDHSDKIELEKYSEIFPYLNEKSLEKKPIKSYTLNSCETEKVNEVTASNLCENEPAITFPSEQRQRWGTQSEACAETVARHSKADCSLGIVHSYPHLTASRIAIANEQDTNEIHLNDKTVKGNDYDDEFSASNNVMASNAQNYKPDEYVSLNVEKDSVVLKKIELNSKESQRKESLDNSDDSCEEFDPFEGTLKSCRVSASLQISGDSDNCISDPDMEYASKLVAPLKNLAKKKQMLESKEMSIIGCSSKYLNTKQLSFLKENSIIDSNAACSKQSRLSLKSRSSHKKFKRIQSCESSDESETDQISSADHLTKKDSSSMQDQTKFFQSDKSSPLNRQHSTLKNATNSASSVQNKEEAAETTSTSPNEIGEEHCTLNSILSDEIKDADANEIVMEIEDLDSKIKSLEAKLKQCGHAGGLKQSDGQNENKAELSLINKDDNEDSIDLFAESIPPTPPDALS